MHARVGPSGADGSGFDVAQSTQRVFHDTLHGPLRRLTLPPGEAGAVVMEDKLDRTTHHPLEGTRRESTVKEGEWVEMLDAPRVTGFFPDAACRPCRGQ
jgi:hypothetical protein